MSQRLQHKVALITGGSTGIGLGSAKRLIDEGAFVYITGRRQEELDAAVAELGPNARGIQGDISRLEDLDRLYGIIAKEKGHLDVLFANAGGGSLASIEEVTEEHYDRTFDINVKGTLFTVQKALPLLNEGASIILNASAVSIKGIASFGVYAATKAALRSFVRSWSLDLRDRKIRVNAVSPGAVSTPGADQAGFDFEAQSAMTAASPSARPGTVEEIAGAVAFLASADSSYVNGAELFVDGGLSQV